MKTVLRGIGVASVLLAMLAVVSPVFGQEAKTPEQLAKESEEACMASASTKATPQMVLEKVKKACELVEKEGKACFPKFKGKNSEFIYAGTYFWINDMDGKVLLHPVKVKMEGTTTLAIKDTAGKLFFVEFIDVCKSKGEGWVVYDWPKPGEKTSSKKLSYVKKAKCDGVDVVVGSGIYDVPEDEIKKLIGQ